MVAVYRVSMSRRQGQFRDMHKTRLSSWIAKLALRGAVHDVIHPDRCASVLSAAISAVARLLNERAGTHNTRTDKHGTSRTQKHTEEGKQTEHVHARDLSVSSTRLQDVKHRTCT